MIERVGGWRCGWHSTRNVCFNGNYSHDIADYDWFGHRLVKKTMGNDATLHTDYDGKRRVSDYDWKDATASRNLLDHYVNDVRPFEVLGWPVCNQLWKVINGDEPCGSMREKIDGVYSREFFSL